MTNPTYGPTPQELDLAYIEAKSVSFFQNYALLLANKP